MNTGPQIGRRICFPQGCNHLGKNIISGEFFQSQVVSVGPNGRNNQKSGHSNNGKYSHLIKFIPIFEEKIERSKRYKTKPHQVWNNKKFKKLMNYADKIKVSKIAIIGEKDLEQGKITVKDMISGDQELVDIDNIVEYIKGE